MNDEPILLVDDHGPAIRTITMNRPAKRNALNVALLEALRDAVRGASKDLVRRVLIVRGAGPAFCAGLDLSEAATDGGAERAAQALAELFESIATSPLVTIAAAQGAAIGGGAGMLAACDFAIAAEDLRIGYPEVTRGLVAALVTCLLRRQLSDRTIRELVLLGRTVPADEAQRLGLVNRVVPAADLQKAAIELAHEACGGAPGAIARSKRLLEDLDTRPIAESLRRALADHLNARHSAEATEGIAAFREKRLPRWGARLSDG